MSNGTDADDSIKCLPEGDSHSVTTIKLDERGPSLATMSSFGFQMHYDAHSRRRRRAGSQRAYQGPCEYSSFLIKAGIDM